MSYLFVYVIKGYVYSPDFTYMSLLVLISISSHHLCFGGLLLIYYYYLSFSYVKHTKERERR